MNFPMPEPSLRERVARAMWNAMVNDEPPDVETLDREGFLNAADAAIRVVLDEVLPHG